MEGFEVVRLDDVIDTADIFVTTTGNFDIITAEHMSQMKHNAIVGNIGHFDNEIDMAGLENTPGIERSTSSRRSTSGSSPTATRSSCSPRAACSTSAAPPATRRFVMSASFTNQVLAQIELHDNAENYDEPGRHPAQAPRREGRPAPPRQLGANLTELTKEQADYIGVPVEGPYKPDHYRY